MKKLLILLLLFVFISVNQSCAQKKKDKVKIYKNAEAYKKVDIDKVSIGKWTMNYDEVLKRAKKKDLPILINFTGSDWCHWCKLMEKNVFSTKEWNDFVKKNIYIVWIDFPRDKSLVPEKYVERNQQLAKKYGIQGFPAYLILDSDGKTILGQTGAGQEKTGQSFVEEIKTILLMQSKNVKKLSKEKRIKFKNLKKEKENIKKELMDWFKTRPSKTEENIKKYKGFIKKIEELDDKIKKIF